jgi:hypothetical protein
MGAALLEQDIDNVNGTPVVAATPLGAKRAICQIRWLDGAQHPTNARKPRAVNC